MEPATHPTITSEQYLTPDASVYSAQSVLIPFPSPPVTPLWLYRRYLEHIRRWTRGVITPVETPGGLSFRLTPLRTDLITFAPPLIDDHAATITISGGWLVQRENCHRGSLTLSATPCDGGTGITLILSDYCPLILGNSSPSPVRKLLYRFTQAFIHRLVTVHFLERVYTELTGSPPPPSRIIRSRRGDPL